MKKGEYSRRFPIKTKTGQISITRDGNPLCLMNHKMSFVECNQKKGYTRWVCTHPDHNRDNITKNNYVYDLKVNPKDEPDVCV